MKKIGIALRMGVMILFTLFFSYRLALYGAGYQSTLAPGEWWCIVTIISFWGLRSMIDLWRAIARFRSSTAVFLNTLSSLLEGISATIQNHLESEEEDSDI